MDANQPQQHRRLEAYGESKTMAAWARDPRCVVSVNTVRTRLIDGWSLEDAISTPAWRRRRSALSAEDAAVLKAAADLVRSLPRVHRNTPADAPERIATRERNELMRQAAGRASIAEVARAVGLSHEQACYHLRGGRRESSTDPARGARRATTCAPVALAPNSP